MLVVIILNATNQWTAVIYSAQVYRFIKISAYRIAPIQPSRFRALVYMPTALPTPVARKFLSKGFGFSHALSVS